MRLLLALALATLALPGPSLCEDATVKVILPDDENFRKYSFNYLTINTVQQIDSVTSSALVDKFDVDRTKVPHRIVFKSDLPPASYQLTVVDATTSMTHRVNLIVTLLTPSAIYDAVFFTGPTASVNSLLKNLGAKINLISLVQVNSSTTEVAAQVLQQPPSAGPQPLWQAYELMTTETAGSGVQLMPDRCSASSSQLCRTRLAFPADRASTQPALVQLGSTDNFLGFNLAWQPQTVDQMHAEACGPGTCLNNGTCVANFTGVGFRCICPSLPNIPWGPRCEHPTRSYNPGTGLSAFTRHWIGNLPHSSESFKLSLEFSGTVQQETNETFALKSSSSSSGPLISISPIFYASQLKVQGSLLGDKVMLFDSVPQLNSGGWFSFHLLVMWDSVRAALCPKNLPDDGSPQKLDCQSQENVTRFAEFDYFRTDFQTFWLELGKGLKGCLRSVAVNGYSVDLAAGAVMGPSDSNITPSCGLQASTCGQKPSSSVYACGAESVCYGRISSEIGLPMDCNCQCLGSKRRILETVTNSGACRKDDAACTKDPWILSTVSDSENRWFLTDNQSLKLPSTNTASLQLEIRTRNDSVANLLTGKIFNATTHTTQRLSISNGFLVLCNESSCCFQFPPTKVNDGEWHVAVIDIDMFFLRLTVDGVSSIHYRGTKETGFESMNLSVAIGNSNLRNIRVSGIYMSTTLNSTDSSSDTGASLAVVPILASGVTVGPEGHNPAPTCSCPPTEGCVRLWGATSCECPAGQERDSAGNCAAVNLCSKHAISCPGGGTCQPASGEPGFECLCPEGVTSRLCVSRSVSTAAPATAAVQWWIWLIVAIIVLAMLACLLFLLLLVRRRRSKAAAGGGLEIEKVHEGMGVDSENEGVPPADYPNITSLHFPPTKDGGNGALPNFQPVTTAPPPGTVTGRPAVSSPVQAAAAAAPVSGRQTPDPDAAAGDETLNYGYEDTRDDDAADLDEVSLVSADTDYSFDLKPTLDAWGPKFQPLSNILT